MAINDIYCQVKKMYLEYNCSFVEKYLNREFISILFIEML